MSSGGQYLLDTNVLLAYVRAGQLGSYIEATYQLQASSFRPLICVVTVGEIRAIAERHPWGDEKRNRLTSLLNQLVCVDISEPEVLDAYVAACNALPKGITLPQNDLWIAATTMATKSCLLSTDQHFAHLGDLGLLLWEWINPVHGKPKP